MNAPLIGQGHVHHVRLRPVKNSFRYPTYFLRLPMRSLQGKTCPHLKRNRFGLISFFDADHGDGRANSLAWLDELLLQNGVFDAAGEVWLQCYPRVLGHTFKPVSFWFCHRADNSLSAIVVEVNNTFGERHCYLLCGPKLAWGQELQAAKVFHVSPFCETRGHYRFKFLLRQQPAHILAIIDHDDDEGLLLHTSVSGKLSPLNRRSMAAAFWGMPLMTLGVVARIHWQAFKLWRKRVPFFRKPPAPTSFTTR
jgi:uncharacterized protein